MALLRSLTRAAKTIAGDSSISTVFGRRHSSTAAVSRRMPPPMPSVVVNGRRCYDYDLCNADTKCPSIPSMVASHGYQIHKSPPDQFATALAHFALDCYNAKQSVNLELLRVTHIKSKKEERILCHLFLEKAEYNDDPQSAMDLVEPLSSFLPTVTEGEYVKQLPQAFRHDKDVDGFVYHITLEAVDSRIPNTFIAKLWVEQYGNMLQMEEMMPVSSGKRRKPIAMVSNSFEG